METKAARSFLDLVVWQKAHALVLRLYRLASALPKLEQYGLASQIRRAAVSVPANIAEGFKRSSRIDKARMLNIAQGSLEEMRYYIVLMKDLGFQVDEGLGENIDEVSRLLDAYRRKILASAQ